MENREKYVAKAVSEVLQGNLMETGKSALGHLRAHGHEVQTGTEGVTITTNTTTQTVVSRGPNATQNPIPGSQIAHDGEHPGYNEYTHGPDQGFGPGHASQPYFPSRPPDEGPYPSPGRSPRNGPYPQPAYNPLPGPLPPARPPSPPPMAPAAQPPPGQDGAKLEDDNAVVVGLKVYTKGVTPTAITARLNVPASQ